MTTMSPAISVGIRNGTNQATKILPFIAWSMTNGAVMAFLRKPATKVVVFRWPYGACPMRRSPRLQRPRRVGSGLVDENEPVGIKRRLFALPLLASRRHVGAQLLRRAKAFF